MNWLQAAKELVKLIHGEIYSSLSIIFKEYFLTKTTKFLASLILRRSRSFATFVTRSLPLILAGKSADELMRSFVELIVLWTFSIQSWFICVASSETELLMLMSQVLWTRIACSQNKRYLVKSNKAKESGKTFIPPLDFPIVDAIRCSASNCSHGSSAF